MFKPFYLIPLLVVAWNTASWSDPVITPDTKAVTRISPITGGAASLDAPVASPLLLAPLEAEKTRSEVLSELQERAGVALSLAPVPPRGDVPNSWMVAQYDAAKSERELWWLFGQHLLMAQSLVGNRFTDERDNGLDIARIVARQIIIRQKEGKLAAGVLQGWVLPFYSECEGEGQIAPSRVDVANALILALDIKRSDSRLPYAEQYGAVSELIEAHRLLISVTTDESDADYSRWQMALLFERLARFDEGIACLREVDPRGKHRGAWSDIPRLEKKRDEQQKAKAALARKLAEKTPETPETSEAPTQPATEAHAP